MADSAIIQFLTDNHCGKIILIGHSRDDVAVIETSERLNMQNIMVDILIQIDSYEIFKDAEDNVLPQNVTQGVNLFSTSNIGFNGERNVIGSINIGFDNTTHTDIDNGIGDSVDPRYPGTPYDVIK